jgi:hypothetical protein
VLFVESIWMELTELIMQDMELRRDMEHLIFRTVAVMREGKKREGERHVQVKAVQIMFPFKFCVSKLSTKGLRRDERMRREMSRKIGKGQTCSSTVEMERSVDSTSEVV